MARNRSPHASPLERALRGTRKLFLVAALATAFVNLAVLALPIYSLQLFDRVLSARSLDTLFLLTVAVCVAIVVMSVLDFLRGRLLMILGVRLEHDLSSVAMEHALGEAARNQRLSTDTVRDLSEVRNILSTPGIYPLLDLPWGLLFIGVLFFLHPALGWLALIGAVLLALVGLATILATRLPDNEFGQRASTAVARVEDFVRRAEAIRAMGMGRRVAGRWQAHILDVLRMQTFMANRLAILSAVGKGIRMLLQVGVLAIAVTLTLDGQLSAGAMIAGSILLARALQPVEQGMSAWRTWESAWNAYNRLAASLADAESGSERMKLPTPMGALELRGVTVTVPGRKKPILQNISLSVPAGGRLGVIGASGAGKSALGRVIVGITAPGHGEVKLDGADIPLWDPNQLGDHVGYLPQSVQLLTASVRDNIARFCEHDPKDVVAAAELAGLHEAILDLPDGYDTVIGEGGVPLPGGMLQRIGLARALFGQPTLLVLDEPNANLDVEGERALERALKAASEWHATIILITHRMSVLNEVDFLVLLRDGRIDQAGERSAVLQKLQSAK